MGGNGVSDIGTRAGEGFGGVVNGAGLTSGAAVLWGWRLVSIMSWRRL